MRNTYKKILSIVFYTMIISFLNSIPVLSQSNSPWEIAKHIPFYDDIYPPILVSDQNHTVHAFNSQLSTDQETSNILYRNWNINTGWSKPIDILFVDAELPPNLTLQGVLLDQTGQFHLIYITGSTADGTLNYTRAWASEVSIVERWSKPIEIARDTGPLANAALTGDNIGNLYIVYVGKTEGVGIYEIHSHDNGNTWSQPVNVAHVSHTTRYPYHIQLELDPNGILHAVWSLINSDGLGESVYYSRRDSQNEDWSEPILIAAREDNDYATDWPSIKYHKGELFLMYMDGIKPGGVPPTQWMRRSFDNGRTWSNPIQPFPHVGEYGYVVMLEDSKLNLHIILAARVGNPAIGGIWHGVWQRITWSQLELITAKSSVEATNFSSYPEVGSASRPNATIVQGNIILSTWWHDGVRTPVGYSYLALDIPELPIIPLSKPEFVQPVERSHQNQTIPTEAERRPTQTADIVIDDNNQTRVGSLITPLLISIIAIILFVAGIAFFRR